MPLYNYTVEATHPLYHLNNDQASVFVVVAKNDKNAHEIVEDMIGDEPDLKVTYLGIADGHTEPKILLTAYRIELMDKLDE